MGTDTPRAGCSPAELALKQRFEAAYSRVDAPVMQAIERQVCGCDYGGNSWTTRDQAEELIAALRLGPGKELLDLGAGSGWPGLYIAQASDCAVTLVDLPENGLRIAAKRAARDGIAERVATCVADAAALPFDDSCFDAVNHSDLLCCLVRKTDTLAECRRVLRPSGRMAFTVISVVPGLDPDRYARALAHAPDFVETETGESYAALLGRTGWRILAQQDNTAAYEASCRRQSAADRENRAGLVALLGHAAAAERIASWTLKLAAIRDGLYLRESFLCAPA